MARLIVIGANAAGLSGALRAMRRNPKLEVLVLEASADISWGACGMPYNLADEMRDPEDLHVRSQEKLEASGIRIALNHRVVALDRQRQKLLVSRSDTREEFSLDYNRLLIASGSRSRELHLPGTPLPILNFKHLEDLRRLKPMLSNRPPVSIVGAGPVGLELCEALTERGCSVTLIDREELPLPGWPLELRELVRDTLDAKDVELVLGEVSSKLPQKGLVLNCTGTLPNTEWAVKAGLACDSQGRLLVDDEMATSDVRIFAAGDCVIRRHLVSPFGEEEEFVYNPQALEANRCGRVAGWNAAALPQDLDRQSAPRSPATMILRLFDRELARTGRLHTGKRDTVSANLQQPAAGGLLGQALKHHELEVNREVALTAGIRQVHTHGPSRAHGMPDSQTLHVWLESRASGELRGAALFSPPGGALRIDVIAGLLAMKATVDDLAALDLAYSPPFGPAWDPLLTAASALKKALAD